MCNKWQLPLKAPSVPQFNLKIWKFNQFLSPKFSFQMIVLLFSSKSIAHYFVMPLWYLSADLVISFFLQNEQSNFKEENFTSSRWKVAISSAVVWILVLWSSSSETRFKSKWQRLQNADVKYLTVPLAPPELTVFDECSLVECFCRRDSVRNFKSQDSQS